MSYEKPAEERIPELGGMTRAQLMSTDVDRVFDMCVQFFKAHGIELKQEVNVGFFNRLEMARQCWKAQGALEFQELYEKKVKEKVAEKVKEREAQSAVNRRRIIVANALPKGFQP